MRRVDFEGVAWVSIFGMLSLGSLVTAWPYIWPVALTRPFVAVGRHGDPVTLVDALVGTLVVLTSSAVSDAPLVMVAAVFYALMTVAAVVDLSLPERETDDLEADGVP